MNQKLPLFRLVKALEAATGATAEGVNSGVVEALVAQAGAEDAATVRLAVKENRKLSATEVAELLAAYEAGESQKELARRFGMHEQTVRAQLKRQGARLRPKSRIGEVAEARIRELYVLGWSGPRIGRELGLTDSTVYRALKRMGVEMRPPIV